MVTEVPKDVIKTARDFSDMFGDGRQGYNAFDIAVLAIMAERERQEAALSTDAEPVGYFVSGGGTSGEPTFFYHHEKNEDYWRDKNFTVVPLYAVPPAPSVAVKAGLLRKIANTPVAPESRRFSDTNAQNEVIGYERAEWMIEQVFSALSAQVQDGYALVPKELTPQIRKRLQMQTEIGSYVCENLVGAYGLMDEYHSVMLAAAPAAKLEGEA